MSTSDTIPDPDTGEALAPVTKIAGKEGRAFDGNKVKTLDLRLRRFAGYGAIVLSVAFYGCGVYAVALFLGLTKRAPAVGSDHWHIVVAVLVALFSVPTFLLLSIFRSTSGRPEDREAQSLHEAIGNKVLTFLEELLKKRA